ncbi:MAG TPA: nickel pincer cofactor biosynthesis protein LarB [Acidobacteriota bacterium]
MKLIELLSAFQAGRLTVEEVESYLASYGLSEIGLARFDEHRHGRTGFPEIVYAPGKDSETLVELMQVASEAPRFASRLSAEQLALLHSRLPQGRAFPAAGLFLSNPQAARLAPAPHPVAVLSGGHSDRRVAEEAAVVLEVLGYAVRRGFDVGVAGLHRLFEHAAFLAACRAVVVVAGMDGALPSVVAGLVAAPVIAVPTSVGYGAAFGGIAALLAMLNSCAPGVSVVNIDNGVGAAAVAHAFLRQIPKDANG